MKNTEKGFTIIEVIISAFIFSIIAVAISGIFVQALNIERRAFSAQKIQEQSLYVLELMAREIRVASISGQDSNCATSSLSMTHPVNGNVSYNVNNGIVQRTENGVDTEISSGEVNFTRLNFCITGSNSGDDQPARVSIIAGVQNRTGKEILTFDLQTTVTSRDLQSEF